MHFNKEILTMIELPCIENKCILYPVCRHKKVIYCTSLHKLVTYINKRAQKPNILYSTKPLTREQQRFKDIFPNLYRVWMDRQ